MIQFRKAGFMKTLGNVIWFILIGIWVAIYLFILGAILYITVVGIPLGMQCFKIAKLVIFPFGKTVKTNFEKHPVANLIWMIFFGWEAAVFCLIVGLLFCITIIGIPFGKQCFKLAFLVLMPFGAKV